MTEKEKVTEWLIDGEDCIIHEEFIEMKGEQYGKRYNERRRKRRNDRLANS